MDASGGYHNTAQTLTTDVNGEISISNVWPAEYEITEIGTTYGYKPNGSKNITVTPGLAANHLRTNLKETGNLKIKKVDADSNKNLKGISFKIKTGNNYIVAHDSSGKKSQIEGSCFLTNLDYTTDINSATTFVTDSNGEIVVYNMWIGTYSVEEVSVGTNYEYEIDNDYISWVTSAGGSGKGSVGTIVVNRQLSTNTTETNALSYQFVDTITFKNKKKYIQIGGYVWEDDTNTKDEDASKRDNLYMANTYDKRVSGIPVVLKQSNGNLAQLYNPVSKKWGPSTVITTGSQGEYAFGYILIDDVTKLYIEFQYNGMGYDNVAVNLTQLNGNKASEGNARIVFNSEYDTITYSKAVGPHNYSLKYDTSESGVSKLMYADSKSSYDYGYAGNESSRAPFTGITAI